MSKPIVMLPDCQGFHSHWAGHAFRNIVTEWQRLGLAEVRRTKNPYVWWGGVGEHLLYDRPTLQWLDEIDYKLGLFGNTEPPPNGHLNLPWIFWPRTTTLTMKYHVLRSPGFHQRPTRCCWLGASENRTQRGFRWMDYWSKCCDFYSYCEGMKSAATNWRSYTNQEYLRIVRRSRFGLCLRGYGPKCNREIELFALGCVPIYTPGMSLAYYDPPQRGIHYIFAETMESALEQTQSMPEDQWQAMSDAGREWYARNSSPSGAFLTTKTIIETHWVDGTAATNEPLQFPIL